MSELITTEELKACKYFLKAMKIDQFNFDDIDYNQVKMAILSSPFIEERLKLAPPRNYVHRNDDGKCYIESNQEKIEFDEKYFPMVSLAVDYDFNDKNSVGFIKELLKKIEDFFKYLKGFSSDEKRARKSMIEFIKNIDTNYLNMRKGILNFEDKCDNKTMELLFLLPDLTLYLVKFIGDKDVPTHLKWSLVTALLYIILPIDILPEQILGAIGMVDDLYVAISVVVEVLFKSEVSEEKIKEYWPGRAEDLQNLVRIADEMNHLLGSSLTGLIKSTLKFKDMMVKEA